MIVVGFLIGVATMATCWWLGGRYSDTSQLRWIALGVVVFFVGLGASRAVLSEDDLALVGDRCWNMGGRSDDNC